MDGIMNKDSFFDTNVIINYAYYYEGSPNKIKKKCFEYIKNKVEKFIICYFVEKELFNFLKKRSILHKEVLKKIEDKEYLIEDSKILLKKDIPYAKKLYEYNKEKDLKEVSKIFYEERIDLEIKIERFLKIYLNEKVIPIENIQAELVNSIFDVITNHADCKIIASALQYRQERKEDFIIITADNKDLDTNSYNFLKKEERLKNYIFPELKNICEN